MIEDLAYNVAEYYGKKNNKLFKAVGGGIDNYSTRYLGKELVALIKRHVNVMSAAGIADAIPGGVGSAVAVSTLIASTWKMYYDINKCLGISFSENFLKSVATGIVSNLASNGVGAAVHAGVNLINWIPVIGQAAGAVGGLVANRSAAYTAAVAYLEILKQVADQGGTLSESSFNSVVGGSSNNDYNANNYTERGDIDEAVISYIASYCHKPASSLHSFTVLKSIGCMNIPKLSYDIEQRFDFSIPYEKLSEIRTVGDLVNIVKKYGNNGYASNDTTDEPAKSGDSSSVTVSKPVYEYNGDSVSFSCDRIDNDTTETTGTLSVICWVSEKERIDGEWANDNFALVGQQALGVLEEGYGFPDVNCLFDFDKEIKNMLNDLNHNGSEWHFVFTINELHEDGNKYIIYTINCPNQNKNSASGFEQEVLSYVRNGYVRYGDVTYLARKYKMSEEEGLRIARTLTKIRN